MSILVRVITTASLALAGAIAAQVAAAPAVTTVAQYPHGQFLENLDRDTDGSLFVTSYIDRRLLRWRGAGVPVAFAELPAHPVGILVQRNRIIVSAHGASFTNGPAFLQSNQMLVLDRTGKLVRHTSFPRRALPERLGAARPG